MTKKREQLRRSYPIPEDAEPEIQTLTVLVLVVQELETDAERTRVIRYLADRFANIPF